MKTEGYKVQEYHGPVKRYCQTMDLRDNAEFIRKYNLGVHQGELLFSGYCCYPLYKFFD